MRTSLRCPPNQGTVMSATLWNLQCAGAHLFCLGLLWLQLSSPFGLLPMRSCGYLTSSSRGATLLPPPHANPPSHGEIILSPWMRIMHVSVVAPAGTGLIELAPFWACAVYPTSVVPPVASLPVEIAVHHFRLLFSSSILRCGPSRIILAHHSGQTSSEQGAPALCGALLSEFGQIHVPLGPKPLLSAISTIN